MLFFMGWLFWNIRLIGLDQVIENSTPIHALILDVSSFDKSHKELHGFFGTEIVKDVHFQLIISSDGEITTENTNSSLILL